MQKKPKLPLSPDELGDGRLADGSLRFVIVLPPDLADLFEAEMEDQMRKKLPLARFIIAKYFRNKIAALEKTTQAIKRLERDSLLHLDEDKHASNL